MDQSIKFIAAAVVFVGLMSAFTVGSRAADSACKGLAQDACGTQGCSWVKAHKRSKGKEVAAFCRKKPGSKSTTTSAAVSPKS
jgi:hypothetical protein